MAKIIFYNAVYNAYWPDNYKIALHENVINKKLYSSQLLVVVINRHKINHMLVRGDDQDKRLSLTPKKYMKIVIS